MKKILAIFVMAVIAAAFISDVHAKKKGTMRVLGGSSIPKYGLVLDASYDSRFDNFADGYKIFQVAVMNNSFSMIPMDPAKDEWVINLEGGRTCKAISDLSVKDPQAWNALPERVRDIMAYPLILPIGVRRVIDLFVPDKTPLESVRSVEIDINSMDTKFDLVIAN